MRLQTTTAVCDHIYSFAYCCYYYYYYYYIYYTNKM